ncbi:MAG: NADP-dependent phosphogluconate dehydrogenase [Proteobacteria bacterium]|nr:NADP-dependent phosphogluconate dehydrogenase [Pseudomonadota bacterium]
MDIGIIGLGVMGANFALNLADHGYRVVGYDMDANKVAKLNRELNGKQTIQAVSDIAEFVQLLRRPRSILLLVPAGSAVSSAILALIPYLQADDLIIDAGNSYFKDTDGRAEQLKAQGILYLGMGISGGESGARLGPSLMPGGPLKAYAQVQPMLEAVAAKANSEPCVAYLGQGSCGHFVKMVHNGIEYALMQLIAETYALMKLALNYSNEELKNVYLQWNNSELNSYLLEITSHIFDKIDQQTGTPLIDLILPAAEQHGTGIWTSQSALELQAPTPTIDIAVIMRNLSDYRVQRAEASRLYPWAGSLQEEPGVFIDLLKNALFAGYIIAFAQGFALFSAASKQYGYQLDLEVIARIWRGGCIIRAGLLESIRKAYSAQPDLSNLLLDAHLAELLKKSQESLRRVVCHSAQLGLPVPGLMSVLSYFEAYRSCWLPANLIQAQRDYFGAHTYQRVDLPGIFHTDWQ